MYICLENTRIHFVYTYIYTPIPVYTKILGEEREEEAREVAKNDIPPPPFEHDIWIVRF